MARAQTLILCWLIFFSGFARGLEPEASSSTGANGLGQSNEAESAAQAQVASLPEFSGWRAVFSRAGFLGKYAGGVSYEFNPRHALEFSIGVYQVDNQDYYQSNLIYRYSRWSVQLVDKKWQPLQIGFFTVRTWDREHYFLRSPDQYPYKNYYDETAFRWGLEFGTTFQWTLHRLALSYHFRILDNGLIAIYNNVRRDLQYYVSSGLSLQYLF